MIKTLFNKNKSRDLEVLVFVLCVIALAVSIGIPNTAHAMKQTANNYMLESNALNLEYRHTLGIDKEMVQQLSSITNSQAVGVIDDYSFVRKNHKELVTRVVSLNDVTKNDLTLISGTLTVNDGEALVDSMLIETENLKLNDTLEILGNDTFGSSVVKVVGFVTSNLYMTQDRGTSSLGLGKVDGFIYAKGLDVKSDLFTSVRFNSDLQRDYEKVLKDSESLITNARMERISSPIMSEIQARQDALDAEIFKSNQTFKQREQKLDQVQLALQDAHSELELSIGEIANDFELNFGPQSLQSKHDTLLRLVEDLNSNELLSVTDNQKVTQEALKLEEEKLSSLELKISETKDEEKLKVLQEEKKGIELSINDIKLDLEQLNREILEINDRVSTYKLELSRINNGIATYNDEFKSYQNLYAAFLKEKDSASANFDKIQEVINLDKSSVETLEKGKGILRTREEVIVGYREFLDDSERIMEIGRFLPMILFLALSFVVYVYAKLKKIENIKHILKTLGILGLAMGLGLVLGYLVVPRTLYSIYRNVYLTPTIILDFSAKPALMPILMTVVSTVVIGVLSKIYFSVKNFSIEKPLVIEKVSSLWNKMSITNRLRVRNFSKMKISFILITTVFSIVLALLFSSINYKLELYRQNKSGFNNTYQFDGVMAASENFKNYDPNIQEVLPINFKKISVESVNASLYIFEDGLNIDRWISLKDEKDNKIFLNSQSVVISDSLSKFLNINSGDSLILEIDDESYSFEVSKISYDEHIPAVFMSHDYYQSITGKDIGINSVLFKVKGGGSINELSSKASLTNTFVNFNQNLLKSTEIYSWFLTLAISVITLVLLSMIYALVVLLKELRAKDTIIFTRLGKEKDSIQKSIFGDLLVYILCSHCIAYWLSYYFFKYIVQTSLGLGDGHNLNWNLISMLGIVSVSLLVVVFVGRALNKFIGKLHLK